MIEAYQKFLKDQADAKTEKNEGGAGAGNIVVAGGANGSGGSGAEAKDGLIGSKVFSATGFTGNE